MSKVESAKITNPSGIKDEAAHIILEGAWKYFVLEEVRELGKHVLSFWVKGKTTGSMAVSYADEQQEVSVTTDWQRVVFKFNADCYTNPWIYFSGTEYWMYNTQLELGDFATDYGRNPADVEQEIADTKEQVEQYRKETSAEILITQDKITQSVTGLEERISKDYYTKTETSSIIAQTQNGILQTVSANITETRTYAETTASAAQSNAINVASKDATNKANAAQANAIADTANKLKSYSTTTQMNSAIDQKANAITSTVAATYTTKGETTTITQNLTKVEQTANKIGWLVKSGTSASNFTLTDRTAELVASYINIKGLVQFSGLDSNAQTTINSANTNAQYAKNIVSSWSAASNTTLIDGGKIYTGSITADKLNVTDLSALGATIGGFTINQYGLHTTDGSYSTNLWAKDPGRANVFTTSYGSDYFYIHKDCSILMNKERGSALDVNGGVYFAKNASDQKFEVDMDTEIGEDLKIFGGLSVVLDSVFRGATFSQQTIHRAGISTTTLSSSGKATLHSLEVNYSAEIGTTLSVTGTSTFTGKTTHNGGIETSTLKATGTISGSIAASSITSGQFSADRIPNLSASKITSGTFNTDRIPGLDASKITSGTFNISRLINGNKKTVSTVSGDLTGTPSISEIKTKVNLIKSKLNDLINALKAYGLIA